MPDGKNKARLDSEPVRQDTDVPFADSLLRTLAVTDAAADATVLVLTVSALLPVIQGMNALTKSNSDTSSLMLTSMGHIESVSMSTLARAVVEILGSPDVVLKKDSSGGDKGEKKTKEKIVIEENIYPSAFYGAPVVT